MQQRALQLASIVVRLYCAIKMEYVSAHCRGESQVARWMVDEIISQEPKAERSLMHRFNIALVSIVLLMHHC